MEKNAHFLFGGTNFNKKKFAPNFAKFKDDDSNKKVSFFEEEEDPVQQEEKVMSSMKKKRRSSNSEPVEGFDVFKSSKKALSEGKKK